MCTENNPLNPRTTVFKDSHSCKRVSRIMKRLSVGGGRIAVLPQSLIVLSYLILSTSAHNDSQLVDELL